MKVLGNRVAIQPFKKEETTKGGILLHEVSQKQQAKGTIIGVGDKVKSVKVGDVVWFSPFHYDEITEELFIIEDTDLWAIDNEN